MFRWSKATGEQRNLRGILALKEENLIRTVTEAYNCFSRVTLNLTSQIQFYHIANLQERLNFLLPKRAPDETRDYGQARPGDCVIHVYLPREPAVLCRGFASQFDASGSIKSECLVNPAMGIHVCT